jgi:hypothetical protein
MLAGSVSQFVVAIGSTAMSGAPLQFTVTAEDAIGNVVTTDASKVHFNGTDPNAILPLDTPLTNGVGTFDATFETSGVQTITASKPDNSAINGTSSGVTVTPETAVAVALSAPSTGRVGQSMTVTLTADDTFGNTATGYSGTVNLTTTDATAVLPATATLTNGVGSFSVTFGTPGAESITATPASGGLTPSTASVAVGQIVQGIVYLDPDASGVLVPGDTLLSGRVVYLDLMGDGKFDVGDPTATTDAGGRFAFPAYAAGSAVVREETGQDASDRNVIDETSIAADGSLTIGVVPISSIAPIPIVPNPFGPVAVAGTPSNYVQSLYRSVLGRDGAASEVASWVGMMQGGMSAGQVAQGFVNSTSHRTAEVASYYEVFLGRAPDAGSQALVQSMLGGMSEEQAVEGILASAEFQGDYVTDDAFVRALYLDVLGRQGDAPGIAAWDAALTTGTDRAQVAAGFVGSSAAIDQIVDSFYAGYLRTQVEPGSAGWVSALEAPGGSASTVEVGFLASAQYQAEAQAMTTGIAPVAGASWFTLNLVTPQLANLVQADVTADGLLTRADVLALFSAVETNGPVTSGEFQDLQTIVGNPTMIVMTPSVRNLVSKVVGTSLANQYYQDQTLGNLAVGSTAAQLGQLVNKWFLGLDHPSTRYTYVTPSGTLFGANNSIGYSQIQQGALGDCYFLSSLASIAQHSPQAITNLIVPNGDGTYTVEFYAKIGGVLTPDYVTVDGMVPESGGDFEFADGFNSVTSPTNILWGPLVEKAYAQWTAEGYNEQVPKSEWINAYGPLGDGYIGATNALHELTGDPSYTDAKPANVSFAEMTAAFNAGSRVICGTKDSPADPNVVSNHDYALIGYDSTAQTLTLFSPWGLAGGYDKDVFFPGIITLTKAQFDTDYSDIYFIQPAG